jgi:hypothetical protein
MKIAILALLTAVTFTNAAMATVPGRLDTRSYCRKIVSDGSFGQPKGERKHCLRFENFRVTDDANTFFGNPPETFHYSVDGSRVTFGTSEYELSVDQQTLTTIEGSTIAGTEFRLQN